MSGLYVALLGYSLKPEREKNCKNWALTLCFYGRRSSNSSCSSFTAVLTKVVRRGYDIIISGKKKKKKIAIAVQTKCAVLDSEDSKMIEFYGRKHALWRFKTTSKKGLGGVWLQSNYQDKQNTKWATLLTCPSSVIILLLTVKPGWLRGRFIFLRNLLSRSFRNDNLRLKSDCLNSARVVLELNPQHVSGRQLCLSVLLQWLLDFL